MIQLTSLSQEFYGAWDKYVHNHKEGTIFHLTKWQIAVDKAFGHKAFYYYAHDPNGKICGILPLIQLKSLLFGNILSSVPFAAYGGILADTPEIFNQLLEKAKELTRQLKADYLELKFAQPKDTGLPETDVHVTFIKELSSDHDENMKAIKRKQRAMVRKGIKAGLKAKYSNDYLDNFYEIFAINVHRMGTPVYSKKWFKTLLDVFGSDAELLVTEYEGEIVSGVLSFYYKDTVLPYYGASLVDYRKHAPNDFQYWELMTHAVDRGMRFYDYGRSKKGTGPYRFKTHWGFEPTPLHYQFYLNKATELPGLNPLNPKYKRKIEAWKKLPLSLSKIIGPHLVKNIP